MKKLTIGLFETRNEAEHAISAIHQELGVPSSDISYVYRNTEGDVKEVDAADIAPSTSAEGAKKGAMTGGLIGAIAGLATVAGAIPVIGPIFAAGPLVAALGVGGAVGTTAAGALTGAAAGSLIGALSHLGVREPDAKRYEDQVLAGDVLVSAHHDEEKNVAATLMKHNAKNVEAYALSV